MKVYVVEHEILYSDHWLEAAFDSRIKADEYCIRQGCSKRMSENPDTDWQNPDNPLERMFVIEMEVAS